MRRACSVGGRVDAWVPRRGVVHSVFARAVNLRFDDRWWTLLAADQMDQPSGLRLAADAALPFLHPGDPVVVGAGHVRTGTALIDCRTAIRWAPARWPAATAGLQQRLARLEAVAAHRAWREALEMAQLLDQALDLGDDLALADTAGRVVGRGPGLTPSGDDVLVGLLTVLHMQDLPACARLARAVAPALPGTTDLSRHLLQEAALGFAGRALHELGAAMRTGAGVAAATQHVLALGATSGADAAIGMVAGFRHLAVVPQGALA